MVAFGGGAQLIENHAGLDAGSAAIGIDRDNPSHVFREIEDDGDVAALSGKRGATATREERCAVFAAEGNGGDDVIVVAGKDDADWDLAIVRAVRGIQGAGAVVETDFALDLYLKRFFEAGGVDFRMLCGSGAGG